MRTAERVAEMQEEETMRTCKKERLTGGSITADSMPALDLTNVVHDGGRGTFLLQEEEEDGSSTFWDTLATLYFPILFLWLRRSMFGTANLVRSVLLGQCLRLVVNYITTKEDSIFWSDSFFTPWLQTLVEGKDPNAWPTPPALTLLVVLTIVAFIVHPDGLTWFVLRKLRDGIMVLLESSAACWTTLIQDYGSIATLVALVTLIGIGFLLGAMLRGVMPRTSSKRGVASKERKKKKRKGHYHLRRGRIRQPHFRSTTSPIPEEEDEEPKEVLVADHNNNAKNQSVAKLPRDETPKEPPSRSVPEPTTATATTTTSAAKPRKYSYSTTDSTLPDDVSCGSTSVVSFASAPTAVTMTSASEQSGKSTKSQEEPKRRGNANSSSNKKQKSKRSKQQDRSGSSNSSRNNNNKRSGQKKNRKPVSEAMFAGTTATKDQGKRADGVRGSRKENRLPLKARTQNDNDGKSRLSSSSSSSQRVVPNPVDSFFSSSSPSTLQFAHDNNNDNNSSGATQYHNNTLPAISQNFSSTIGAQPAVSFASSSPPSVRYEQDLSHSFFSSDTGCSAEKMELAAFLARVGITGSACADFIASVTDVEALGRLSEAQFRSYGVSVEQQGLISSLLEERRRPLRVNDQRLSSGVACYGYGVPDYARSVSFAQGDGRYTPGKIELAGFLAQVGLMGSDCADLLATVEDVDTLGRFTDAQYRSYGVSREKQTQIAWMLEQRRRSRAEQMRLWTAPPLVRPPPGLATTTSSYDHLNPFNGSFGEQPTSRNLLIPTASSSLFAQRAMTAVEAEEESRIEAELQELGGQMVGSVLDF